MARYNLAKAAELLRQLKRELPRAYQRVALRLELADEEIDEWAACADAMSIPYDKVTGINPQDAHFLDREVWDLKNTPPEKRPLLLHYHPLVIYRFQVLKQADVVLALFLQGDHFSYEQKRDNFEYYDPSPPVIPRSPESCNRSSPPRSAAILHCVYFYNAMFVDLADLHGNTSDGVHVASTGGVWNILAYGFGGMRDLQQRGDHLRSAVACVMARADVPGHPPWHPSEGRSHEPADHLYCRGRRYCRALGS
jgi:alpha,alpha-trehalose phosphorylase